MTEQQRLHLKAIETDLREQASGEQCGVLLELADRLRWVICEPCGGTGEIIRGQTPDEHSELCVPCEGTGRDCVEVSPVDCNDHD